MNNLTYYNYYHERIKEKNTVRPKYNVDELTTNVNNTLNFLSIWKSWVVDIIQYNPTIFVSSTYFSCSERNATSLSLLKKLDILNKDFIIMLFVIIGWKAISDTQE